MFKKKIIQDLLKSLILVTIQQRLRNDTIVNCDGQEILRCLQAQGVYVTNG